MRFDDATLELLAVQHGLVHRRQLVDLGYTGGQVDAMVRAGQLVGVGHGTYRRTGTPLSRPQAATTAILRCRGGARATGTLLLASLGCEGYDVEESDFTVLLEPGRRLVNVTFCWRPDPAPGLHGATIGGIWGVTPERTIIELAIDLDDDRDLELAADRLRWRTRKGATELRRVTTQLPGHPGVARLERLGLLDDDRPESPGERGLETTLVGVEPPFEWQVRVAPDLRVDALQRDCGLVLEHDGPTHDSGRDRAHDAARDRRIEALGYHVVHTTAVDLRDPSTLRRRLARVRARLLDEHGP
jgi:hypothetical protein